MADSKERFKLTETVLTRKRLKKETVVNILKELKGNTEKELKEIN